MLMQAEVLSESGPGPDVGAGEEARVHANPARGRGASGMHTWNRTTKFCAPCPHF